MKKTKYICALALILTLLVQLVAFNAFAANIAESTTFEYKLTRVDSAENPGNVKAQLYCDTDSEKMITTFGATLVINTDYFDLVDKNGKVITDNYKKESAIIGKEFPLTSTAIGQYGSRFSSLKGLSIISYNENSKEMYVFVCGMAISGIQFTQKSEIASLYLNAKKDSALPSDSVRIMAANEAGTACPSAAVMATQVACTTEVGNGKSGISLSAQDGLLVKAADQTTKQGETTSSQEEQQPTTSKPAAQMSEAEIDKALQQKIDAAEQLKVSDAQKQSPAYQAYEKALDNAKQVLADENATKQEKQAALEQLQETEEAVKEAFPEIGEQLAQVQEAAHKRTPWLFIGIGGAAVIAAAVIIVLIIKKNKSK